MRKLPIPFLLFLFSSVSAFSQAPDWSTSVASIIYDNCSVCHHEGAIAPFPLMSYQDAVDNAYSIQANVVSRKMPPWPADPDYNHFWGEKVLSDEEVTAISMWVDSGALLGDTYYEPDPPVFNEGTALLEVDDTIICPVYTLTTDSDEYRAFVIHSNYTETKYVQELDFIPGNPAVVHHVIYFHDTSDLSWQKDMDTPNEPGIPNTSQAGTSPYCETISGWNPGRDPIRFPSNMGFEIPPGSDIIISVHYAPDHAGETDSASKMYFKFCDMPDSLVRTVRVERYCWWDEPSLLNPPFFIPKDIVKTFYEISDTFQQEMTLMGLAPHCHLLGKTWEVVMVEEPGDTVNLLYIPQWDFNWQMTYFLTKMMKIPVGARFFAVASFDNTTNNEDNPNDPPKNVWLGESTNDEMMAVRFYVLDYQPGDEDYILDSAFYGLPTSASIEDEDLELNVYPNPASDIVHFVTWLSEHHIEWEFTNEMGMLIKSGNEQNVYRGIYHNEIDISGLASGIYFLTIRSGKQSSLQSIVVSR